MLPEREIAKMTEDLENYGFKKYEYGHGTIVTKTRNLPFFGGLRQKSVSEECRRFTVSWRDKRIFVKKSEHNKAYSELLQTAKWHKEHPAFASEPVGIYIPREGQPLIAFFSEEDFSPLDKYISSLHAQDALPSRWIAECRVKLAELMGHVVGCAHKMLVHGDLKPDQFLIKYNADFTPVAVKLVDLEYSRSGVHFGLRRPSSSAAGLAVTPASDLRRLKESSQDASNEESTAFMNAYLRARKGEKLGSNLSALLKRILQSEKKS